MTPITYLEYASISKYADGKGNEDRLFMADGLCAVIDGATSKHITPGPTGGTIADLICEALSGIPPDMKPRQIVQAITHHVRTGLNGATPGDQRASATLLLYSAAYRTALRIGDSHLAINGTVHHGQKRVDLLLAEMRSLYLRLARSWTAADDPGRAVILPVLKVQNRLQNNAGFPDYGYGCIDGSNVPNCFIETWTIPDGAELVLCSDGYLSPAPTLAKAEAELTSALAADPACIDELKGTKAVQAGQVSFDDRSYLRLRS